MNHQHTVNKMIITMKTYYIQEEEDIGNILLNKLNKFINIFEFGKKNIQKSNKKPKSGMDLVLLHVNLTSLQIKKSNSSKSLLRKNSQMYYVSCVNIKNENGECFSSLIDDLSENDRIFIINGVVLKQFTICNPNQLTVLVRSQDNSSVILFKCRDQYIMQLLKKPNSVSINNLSSLTGSGVYSIFGFIKKIIRYNDEELISLRLLCSDKSTIKTLKYYHFNSGYQNIINNKTASDLNYAYLSNKIDILVKTPSNDFTSLSLNQRIHLNNVTVENINDSDIFLLHMNGDGRNIKALPMESHKTIRPPRPDDFRPEIQPKLKNLSDDVQLVLNNNILELNTNTTAFKKPLNVQESKHKKIMCVDLSDDVDDDIVNLSPCLDFSKSTQIIKKDNDASKFGKNKINVIDDNSLPIKHLTSDDQVQKYNDNSSLNLSNKDTSLPKSEICSQRGKSSSSSDSSCSSSSMNSQPESLILNKDTRSNSFKSNIVSQPTQCIGSCRLIHTIPNIFDSGDIVSGFCTTCNAFIQKSYLKLTPQSSNMEYKCPKCSTIVHFTFFFIMNFLYGKNESQAIEICCFGKKAESFVRKISKKKITPEDYLSNQNNEQLVISSMKSLINNKTKVNIIVCFSPEDNKNILLGIDTKYVATTTTQ